MKVTYQLSTKTVILSAVALLSILSSQVRAIPSEAIAQQINCENPGSNVEYKECARRAYEAADRRLNQVYQQVLSRVRGEERQKLIDAEETWIRFRDQHCDFQVYRNRGGTGYGGFLSNCLEQTTSDRTAQLERYLNDQ
ncbi:MAG TPA: lysozyme inhibitor LprI family protein [Coleofasciculaceae cyanobacterium]